MSENFVTEKNWSNKLVLKKYRGSDAKVVIPDDIAELGSEAFKNHKEIEEVFIPEGVKYIGWGAFQDCTALKEIKIPSTVGSISDYAFSGCTSLSKVILPDEITPSFGDYFGPKTFRDCISLTEFIIPEGMDYTYGDLFDGCKNLKGITFVDRSVNIKGKELRNICEVFRNNAIPEQLETPAVKRGIMPIAAKNIMEGKCDDVYKEAWIKYIKSQRKPCFEQIKKNKYLSKLAIQEKILKPQELDDEPEKKEIVSYDISYKEARNKYNFTKRNTGYSINDFNRDGRIWGPLDEDYHYEFNDRAKDPSKVIFIPNTIDGKPVGHVAVKTLPFDAIVVCDAATFGKLDRRVKASTAVAYLEDETQFKTDEAEKIAEFIKKNPLDVARVITNSESPKAYSRFIELGKPNKETISQMIEYVKDKKEITALLLNASGQKQETVELDLAPKKQISIADIKKEWAYDKKTIDINGDYVEGIYLKKYKGINPDVDIPDTIGKNTVLAVGASAFENCDILESVTVPATVKLIDNQAFAGCANLKKIIITGEKTRIGRCVFADCVSLEEINIDVHSALFDIHPFMGCSKIFDENGLLILDHVIVDSKCPLEVEELKIPEGITRIGSKAFAELNESFGRTIWNRKLRSVILPSTIKKIGSSAFKGCKVLQNIVLPEGLETIADGAFADCDLLRELHIPQSVTGIGQIFNYRQNKNTVIYGFSGSEAEKYAINDDRVFIPEEMESERKNPVVDFVVDDGALVKYLGEERDIAIPTGVKTICFNAFEYRKDVKSLTLPDGVTDIEAYVFSDSALETIIMPESMINIDSSAFSFCWNLKNVVLPEGLKSIGDGAFMYTGIEKITIPASVEKIGKDAFLGCDKLETITNLSSVKLQDNQ